VRILMATLFLLPTLSLSSEEEQDPMPASAKRTVAQHDREVQRLKERYLSDLAEIREDTLRDLERDMRSLRHRRISSGTRRSRFLLVELLTMCAVVVTISHFRRMER